MERHQNQGPPNILGEVSKEPDYYRDGDRRKDGMSFEQAVVRNVRTCRPDDKGEIQVEGLHKNESTDAGHRDGATRSSDERCESTRSKGVASSSRIVGSTRKEEELNEKTKPFCICKWDIQHSYKKVRTKGKAVGVDGQTIQEFESNLKDNLYLIWNRMSSGTYFPPPVRQLEIPKSDGKKRVLGTPTISDRIAQSVVTMHLEASVERHFHPDSYGYRPGKSQHDALETARQRCWKYNWAIDLDIKGFFDNLDWELVMEFVRQYTNKEWVILHIERWLKAPAIGVNGKFVERTKGTPQGGVISPLLANIFLHEVFDKWMKTEHPGNPFERYADDVIVHCKSQNEARKLLQRIEARLMAFKLKLHPAKTKIVYCQDSNRNGDYQCVSFDFLGYTFRPRRSKNRHGKYFMNFTPGISQKASKAIRDEMRQWRYHRRSDMSVEELAMKCNQTLAGWINYYGKYYRSEVRRVFYDLNWILTKWAMRKYKRLRKNRQRAEHWLGRLARRSPELFAHWNMLGLKPSAG